MEWIIRYSPRDLNGTSLTVTGYVGSAAGQAAFANVTVQVFVADNDASGFGEGQTYLGTLTTSATNGNFSGTLTVSGLTAADQLTATATDAVNNTSEFGLRANLLVILPINVLNISAQRQNEYNLVRWQADNGLNIQHYEVERSTDGRSFHKIATIASNNEAGIGYYSFNESFPNSSAVYYRIRSIDKTGKSTLSRVVTISDHSMESAGFTISNAGNMTISVNPENSKVGNYDYCLVNTAGVMIRKGRINISGGSKNTIELPAGTRPGIYFIRISGERFMQQEKLFVR